ncbi:glycosyltransferase [Rhodalgimonas zhirmunskyi]|uniref:Chitooligosaccharide deacetylase n=1 Tax=Rhodalgimonas zhirmunskyi TaxID=2964767 RepID=A0AAJ1UB34_9RHOB|nr:glycosyltransferase [Rhodoalgimonas zhirmunskyi]MDQ2092987.1 glycosyltransferase [Rhodoalgimonas zhirmunskyi]
MQVVALDTLVDPADSIAPTKVSFPPTKVSLAPIRAGLGDDHCEPVSAPVFSARADMSGGQIFGHVPSSLEWAPLSLQRSCGALDVIVPDWFSIRRTTHGLFVDVAKESVREEVEAYRNSTATPPQLMPTVLLETGFDTETFLDDLLLPKISQAIASDLLAATEALDASGLCLDFRQLGEEQLVLLDPFFELMSTGLKDHGWASCAILSVEQKVWADQDLMRHFDTVVLKVFRQPWVGSPPGPLAADAWFEDVVTRALAAIGSDRLTLALGSFAVEWTTQEPLPRVLPYAQAVSQVSKAGSELHFSPQTGNTFATYHDKSRRNHKLWLLDAAAFHNQRQKLFALGARNIGVWSLGTEDPGIWDVLNDKTRDPENLASRLSEMRFPDFVSYRGQGPFLRVVSRPRYGQRQVEFDPATGLITDVTYSRLPLPYTLERYGRPAPNKLVLTFDDGPHEEYTSAILDTLKETGTPGAFFVVGTRVMEEPELLKRLIAEGHEVGAHTFSHPRMDLISRSRTELEHGMLDKAIAGYAGRSTLLYREPFMRAGGPIEESRVRSLETVQAAGSIIAGMEIVPKDWEGISAEEIADYVIEEVNKGAGNVILLHDGGKDRSASVEALPVIIRELKAQGYEFTSLADLLGTTPAALMPVVDSNWLLFDRISFGFLSATWISLETIFWLVLAIGVIRTLIILGLALVRQRVRPIDNGYEPKVTVVIPAYNEEAVIANCIRSVLASNYRNFDVIVVDDGSQDETFNEMLRFRTKPNVHIYAQLNQGKWSALNAAVANTTSEVMICIDADTEVHPDAIGHLVRQFSNPKVGAVAGKITVGNRRNLLTRLQALEYVTAQNFDRRAYDLINGMLVVPGAIGAWRTSAVRDAGRYCNDTMTEDADLTIAVNRAGYRITYEEKALAYTEAPDTIRLLLAQRLRWTLGMFQAAWKHKAAFREKRTVGLVSIPDMLIFGYLFPLLAPIADLFVAILLYKFFAGDWTGEVGVAVSDTPAHLIWAYMMLPLLDLVVAAYALKTDKQESLTLLWLFPFQRFFYRQILYCSVYRSLLRALSGTLAGWGRKKRTGYVHNERATT